MNSRIVIKNMLSMHGNRHRVLSSNNSRLLNGLINNNARKENTFAFSTSASTAAKHASGIYASNLSHNASQVIDASDYHNVAFSATTTNASDVVSSSSSSSLPTASDSLTSGTNTLADSVTNLSVSDASVSTTLNEIVSTLPSDPLISNLGYTPDALISRVLCLVHDYSGLPWYGAIILTTIGVRVALLPVVMKSMRNVHRLRQAKPEMERLQQLMKEQPAITEADQQRYMLMTRVSQLLK